MTKMCLEISHLKWHAPFPGANELKKKSYPTVNSGDCQYLDLILYSLQSINGLVQDCGNSIANTLELLQCCDKPSIWLNICSMLSNIWENKMCIFFFLFIRLMYSWFFNAMLLLRPLSILLLNMNGWNAKILCSNNVYVSLSCFNFVQILVTRVSYVIPALIGPSWPIKSTVSSLFIWA